jgi:glutamate/tyrosine decarboxylase-like PLP-dependent enzyme
VERPCGWERTHLVQAAALALEAAGHRPATGQDAAGYRVRATPQPEAVAVREPDGEALRACAGTLERAGWQVSEHKEPRTGRVICLPRRDGRERTRPDLTDMPRSVRQIVHQCEKGTQ